MNPLEQPYGTFTVEVRDLTDHDGAKRVLEAFTGCNLDPNSPDFIARKIGDKRMVWDNDKKRYLELGDHTNMSKYIRVELTEAVQNGSQNPLSLPFGFFGPVRLEDNVYASNVVSSGMTIAEGDDVPSADVASAAYVANTNSWSYFHKNGIPQTCFEKQHYTRWTH